MQKIFISSTLDRKLELELRKVVNESFSKGNSNPIAECLIKIGLILKSSAPEIKRPLVLHFAGDHGFIHGKLPFNIQEESTEDQLYDILNQESRLSLVLKSQRISYKLVDVGVNHSFEGNLDYWLNHGSKFISKKIGSKTQDFSFFPAMSTEQCLKAIEVGFETVKAEKRKGSNCINLSAIGKGNSISAKVLSCALLNIDFTQLKEFINDPQQGEWVEKVIKKHPKTHDPITLLTFYGGYEIAALVGAFLKAASYRIVILVNGFVSCVAMYVAYLHEPKVIEYCIFTHTSSEPLHQELMKVLKVNPILGSEMNTDEKESLPLTYSLLKTSLLFLKRK